MIGILKRALALVVALGVAFGVFYVGAGLGWWGRYEGPGTIAGLKPGLAKTRTPAVAGAPEKQILFGDLHVHTTFSTDAFQGSLPLLQGTGTHPPADAADFARYCSALDFWSLTDHAEGLTPQRWRETIDTIRQANAVAGDPANPDIVAFLGWEWTQVGASGADHYGHKNVILYETEPDKVPTRPIASGGFATRALATAAPLVQNANLALFAPGDRRRYFDFARFQRERAGVKDCPADMAERALPADCFEAAETPKELFRRLDDWGVAAMVIPHGNTWGFYTPAESTWDKQLTKEMNDPKRQFLVEVFSGHGNSEEYRDWRPVGVDAQGKLTCPAPTKDYLPECWRAGEIIAERCARAGESGEVCAERAAETRQRFLDSRISGFRVVPGQSAEDWLDSGQCRDCFRPSYNFRPALSAQYALALTNFDDPKAPTRFEFGFIASSDNHQARPGTGYKQYSRAELTEGAGVAVDEKWSSILSGKGVVKEKLAHSVGFEQAGQPGFALVNTERMASFMMTGGLVAVHATGRDRKSIWDALQRKETYGTSGDRILLWFDLLNGPGGAQAPMGSTVRMGQTPRFKVRAMGAFKQKPGCPEDTLRAISAERLDHLCRGECYNPDDARKMITRIEIIRILPQVTPDEPMGKLIQDPWKTLDCAPDQTGCTAEFDDPDYASLGRPATYYARAVEEPRLAINASNLRCEKDAQGQCVKVNPCYGDFRTPHAENCLAMSEEKAWSSPIFLHPADL